jgi:hypothetical protein
MLQHPVEGGRDVVRGLHPEKVSAKGTDAAGCVVGKRPDEVAGEADCIANNADVSPMEIPQIGADYRLAAEG